MSCSIQVLCSSLEPAHVLRVGLRVMLLKDGGVLGQESCLLLLDDGSLAALFLLLKLLLGKLSLSLLLVDSELLLPESLDFALVFQLTHAASLSVHLLKSVILCELLHQLALEFLLHAFLFLGALSLESELVLACSLEFLADAHSLISLCTFLRLCGLFSLLHIEVVSELLLEHLLGSSLLLFGGELLEDLIANSLGFLLHSLDLILTSLLLLSIPSDHLVLVLVHFALAFQECSFLVLRKNHISLTLLFLLLDDAVLFVVFLDHALNDGINLLFLSQVLLVSLLTSNVRIIDLLLDLTLVHLKVFKLSLILRAFHLVANILVLEHGYVNGSVLLLQS